MVRGRIRNQAVAEDLVQEIWVKAFRAWDGYFEDGRLKGWLGRIAQNHLRNYLSRDSRVLFLSLDGEDEDGETLYACLPGSCTPEEEYLQSELISEVLDVIAKLPDAQRQVIRYRFFDGLSVSETARAMQVPPGTVKSKLHYALAQVRMQLSSGTDCAIKKQKGVWGMECRNTYKYLFMYAKGALEAESRKRVEDHILKCSACKDIVCALERLIPQMTFGREDEDCHFLIHFPTAHLSFCGARHEIEDFERLNALLESRGGKIPESESWMVSGFGKGNKLLGTFDNEGNEIQMEVWTKDERHHQSRAVRLEKVFHYMWEYSVFLDDGSFGCITRAKEAPNLYYGSLHNCYGGQIKSALYQAVPARAGNLRMKRGNGVVDCGPYTFPYADRYVSAEEQISLDYSFLQDD